MSDLDELMSLDPLGLTNADIDAIIAYHRKSKEAGPKPRKETGPTMKVDLTLLGLKPSAPAAPKINRRA